MLVSLEECATLGGIPSTLTVLQGKIIFCKWLQWRYTGNPVLPMLLFMWLAVAGSQLFNSYGPRSNDDLVLRYSFVASDNPDDVYLLDDLPHRLRLQQVPQLPAEQSQVVAGAHAC